MLSTVVVGSIIFLYSADCRVISDDCPDLLPGAGYDILNVKGFNEPEGGKCQKTNILIRRFPV